MGDLDEYQAFQFDLAIAYKGHLRDKEELGDTLHTLLEGMRGIMTAQGAKVSKLQKPKRLVKDPKEDEVPLLRDVISALGGEGVAQ